MHSWYLSQPRRSAIQDVFGLKSSIRNQLGSCDFVLAAGDEEDRGGDV